MPTVVALRRFLWAVAQPRTFYVLGAGASYGLIPVTTGLRNIIEKEYHSIGIYPAVKEHPSPLFERMIGTIPSHEQDIRRQLLTHMPHGALDLLTQRALWRPKTDLIPPQYGFFELTPSPATIFNFNLDGLASLHCAHRHIVLEPHGRIDDLWFERADFKALLEGTIAYGLSLPHLSAKVLPSPEADGITLRPPYVKAQALLPYARAIIILGYSFGQRSNEFDDSNSLEFFVTLFKRNPRPILVISPTPLELVERLRDRLQTSNVHDVPMRWEVFSGLLMDNLVSDQQPRFKGRDAGLRRLLYDYESRLDAQ